MDNTQILEEIENCLSSIPKGDPAWSASIEGQLKYRQKVLLGKDKPNHGILGVSVKTNYRWR